jgi:hypothetical protein
LNAASDVTPAYPYWHQRQFAERKPAARLIPRLNSPPLSRRPSARRLFSATPLKLPSGVSRHRVADQRIAGNRPAAIVGFAAMQRY